MWNQAASSKIIQDKLNRQSYRRHQRSLMNIRSTINTASPMRPHFVYNKYKRRLSEDQRNFEIKSQNAILVQKMIGQKLGNFHKLKNPVFGKQSLNEIIAKKRNSQIMQDNQVSSYLTQLIIRKLTDSKPFYQTRSILHDTDKLLCYMTNISQNARRSTSQTNLGASQRGLDWTSRPITSPNTTRASESFKWNGRYSSARRFRP